MPLNALLLLDSDVVLEAAVEPPIGVAPVVIMVVAHFSRLLTTSRSRRVGCSVSNLWRIPATRLKSAILFIVMLPKGRISPV